MYSDVSVRFKVEKRSQPYNRSTWCCLGCIPCGMKCVRLPPSMGCSESVSPRRPAIDRSSITKGDTLEMNSHSSTGSAGSVLWLEDRSGRRGELAFNGKGIPYPNVEIEIVDHDFTWRQTAIYRRTYIVVCVPISFKGVNKHSECHSSLSRIIARSWWRQSIRGCPAMFSQVYTFELHLLWT